MELMLTGVINDYVYPTNNEFITSRTSPIRKACASPILQNIRPMYAVKTLCVNEGAVIIRRPTSSVTQRYAAQAFFFVHQKTSRNFLVTIPFHTVDAHATRWSPARSFSVAAPSVWHSCVFVITVTVVFLKPIVFEPELPLAAHTSASDPA